MDCTVNSVTVESEIFCGNIRFFNSTCWEGTSFPGCFLMEKEGHAHISQYRMFAKLNKVRIEVPDWLETEEPIFQSQP